MTAPAPERCEALLTEAWGHHQSRRYDRALPRAEDVIRIQPDNPLAHVIAGESLRHLGRRDEASRHLGQAVTLAPGWALAHVALAAAHRERGEHARAERQALEAVRAQPMESAGWCELGLLYHEQGDHANARRCASHALQLEPASAIASSLLAVPPLDTAAAAVAGQPKEPLFRRNLYAALRHRLLHYRLLTIPCQVSLWLSAFLGGVVGMIVAALLGVATIAILIDPFQDIRLPWLGVAAWLLAVCWPSLKLYERLTLRDVPRLARALPPRAGRLDVAAGRLVGRLGWLALTLGGGAAVIGIGLRHMLVETFLAAFVINALILVGTSLLFLMLLESVRSRRRGHRLKLLQVGEPH